MQLPPQVQTRFPHPFVQSFEGTSSVGIKGAVKYFQHLGNGDIDKNGQTETVADILVQKLVAGNVKFVFGIIGDGINPIIEALRKHEDKIKLITVRHEESAAFMACGYAKYTGQLGVCLATSGPGAIHLLNGLYDANKDHVPILAITGAPSSHLAGTDYTQEINVISLMDDVALYNQQVTGATQAGTVVDLAVNAAINGRGVAHLNIARDIQQEQDKIEKQTGGVNLSADSSASGLAKEVSQPESLKSVAEVINSGRKIAILVGQGALAAKDEVAKVAELLAAPVAKALLGKGVLPDDSSYTTGGIGPLGTLPSKELMKECDVLIILGSNMPYLEFYPDNARCIQVDHEPARIGLRCQVQYPITGDVKATLQALTPLLHKKSDRSFLETFQQKMAQWREKLVTVESAESELIRPQFLVAEVSDKLAQNATVSIDTGAHTVFTARHWQLKGQQQLAVSGNLASMGAGLPYSIAAQLAFPERQCVAMVGDGGLSMLMADIATAVRYKLPIKIVVFKNNQLSQDVYEQKAMGNEVYGGDLTPIDFAKVAEGCGALGLRCKKKEELNATLNTAFRHDGPVLVEVAVDPSQAPAAPDGILDNRFGSE